MLTKNYSQAHYYLWNSLQSSWNTTLNSFPLIFCKGWAFLWSPKLPFCTENANISGVGNVSLDNRSEVLNSQNHFSYNKLRENLHSNGIVNVSCWQNISKKDIPKDDPQITLKNT